MAKAKGKGKKSGRAKTPSPPTTRAERQVWVRRLVVGILLWLVPASLIWIALTPIYNPFLTQATENLVRMTESPSVTRLLNQAPHHFLISRTDVPSPKGWITSVRVTDTHFPMVMMIAFFLAVPGVPWKIKLQNLGWALLFLIFFHLFSLFLWVKFVYSTQLGEFSMTHYSALQRNVWGLSKHLADLPFKLGMPLILWTAFYLRQLLPSRS